MFPAAKALPIAAALLAAGCSGQSDKAATRQPTKVSIVTVAVKDYSRSLSLTGVITARVSSNLAFRIAGRIAERRAEVGQHVVKGDLLATIDPTEQKADVVAAQASVDAADAQLAQASANFDRQKTLLSKALTSRRQYDEAQSSFNVAKGSLDAANAGLANARENLAFTELRATADGIVTTRTIEAGQTVQAAQTAFTVAEDGDRDAVFNVPEVMVAGELPAPPVQLHLLADINAAAVGKVREVSPVLDPKTGSVRVKVGIPDTPASMSLGAAVIGSIGSQPVETIKLPWSALYSQDGRPAVWIVDPATKAVSLKAIDVGAYGDSAIFVDSGLKPGEQVVVAGTKLLSNGQVVDAAEASVQ